jgi:hypothetical protein
LKELNTKYVELVKLRHFLAIRYRFGLWCLTPLNIISVNELPVYLFISPERDANDDYKKYLYKTRIRFIKNVSTMM